MEAKGSGCDRTAACFTKNMSNGGEHTLERFPTCLTTSGDAPCHYQLSVRPGWGGVLSTTPPMAKSMDGAPTIPHSRRDKSGNGTGLPQTSTPISLSALFVR